MADLPTAIPASINYQDVLPVAVPAIARRKRFYPQNGTTFNPLGSQEIRVQIQSPNSLLDPQHSYLEFFIENISGQGVGLDLGGSHVFFDEIWVEQAGRVLARQQAHNRLHAGILSSTQTSSNGQLTESINEGQRGLNDGAGGAVNQLAPAGGALNGDAYVNQRHNGVLQLPNTQTARFTMAMPTGLFTQDKLIPLPLCSQSEPLTLCFRLANPDQIGVWSGVPGLNGYEVRRFNYCAQMIEVGGDVLTQMRQMQEMGRGQLTISTTDIEHSQGVVVAGSRGEVPVRVPIRKRSVKSLLFQCNSDDITQAAAGAGIHDIFNLSFGGNMAMSSYQLKVGSVVYPPTPVQCWGAVVAVPAAAQARGECAMELAKALGTLGFTNPTGRLSTLTYGTNNPTAAGVAAGPLADGDNGDGANTVAPGTAQTCSVCPFGLDLDSFQHTAIEAGIDSETMALELNLLVTIDSATNSGGENKNVHSYLIYDQHYHFNSDGSITISN